MNKFYEELKAAFEGFEPEVTPDFSTFEKALESHVDGGKTELSRRYRLARRVAAASTVAALGLFSWVLVNNEPETTEEPKVTEDATWHKFEGAGRSNGMHSAMMVSDLESAARTSSSVVISEGMASEFTEAKERPSEISGGEVVSKNPSPRAQEQELQKGQLVSSDDALPGGSASGASTLGFESSVQEACEGTEVSFKLDGAWTEGSFLWNFGDGSFSSEAEPAHVFTRPGTYDITISVRSHNDGQIRTRTVENMIVVRPRPEAELSWKLPNEVDGNRVAVQLLNKTERSSSSTWLLGEEKLSQSVATLEVPGHYPVHLIASNAYGCQDHNTAVLKLGDRLSAGAPSSFSPDGDGRYDSFLPKIARDSNLPWELKVMDMDGREVFTTTNAQHPWLGESGEGSHASGKRYRWMLTMLDEEGNSMLYTDDVRVE